MANITTDTFQSLLDGGLFEFDSTTGQVIPQTSEVKDAIKGALTAAFGTNLVIEDESPAGRLVEMWTMMMTRFCSVTALYANQINPQYATGQMLDALGSLFSVYRYQSTPSVISVIFYGSVGTVIPKGTKLRDKNNNVFTVDVDYTIEDYGESDSGSGDADGSVVGTATCAVGGPVTEEYGDVTTILDTVSGVNSVTNLSMVSVGTYIETDYHYRKRIVNARWTGTSFLEDINAEINRADGVDSVFVIENPNSSVKYLWKSDMSFHDAAPDPSTNIKYVAINAHSILAVVEVDGNHLDGVAKAIYNTKPAGCGMTALAGSSGDPNYGVAGVPETEPVTDEATGVAYPITFNRPATLQFGVTITVRKHKYVGSDSELRTSIRSALHAWANGEYPYVDGIEIGQTVYPFEVGAAVSDAIPSIQIKNVVLTGGNVSGGVVDVFVNEMAVLSGDSITINIE